MLLAINVTLNLPLFQDGAQPYRGSIEGGYAGIARFFAQHPNPWGWNPYFYCGLPSQFVYLPGVPYAVAMLSWIRPELEPLHAYRIVVATLACLGPVTLFLFAARVGGGRAWAFAAAIGYSLCSPSYDLFRAIDLDRGLLAIPWRLHVMMKYGEGPHNAGLTLLPLALLAVWTAAYGRRPRQIVLAALALAAVALTHWIAAFALALAGLLLLAAHFPPRPTGYRHWPVFAAAGLGYLFAVFWLTPSFVRTVAFNWPKDSFGFKGLAAQRLAAVVIASAIIAAWWLMRKLPDQPYLRFVTLCFVLFGTIAEAHYGRGVDPIPESRRYVLEMEMFLALTVAAWCRWAWTSKNTVNRFCVAACVAVLIVKGYPQAHRFVSSGYANWKLAPKQETVEHRLASWLADRKPTGRVYVSGGLRFRMNSWFSLPQVLGTFDSGLQNRTPLEFDDWFRKMAQMRAGIEGADSLRQMVAMGVEYVVVHGPRSTEYYRDMQKPERFEGLLEPVLRLDDDTIYRVPMESLARAVPERDAQNALPPRYLEMLEQARAGHTPMKVEWENVSRIRVRGAVPKDSVISILVSYAPGWRATQNAQALRVEPDRMGFIRVHAAPSANGEVALEYHATAEQKAAAGVSFSAFTAAAAWIFLHRRRGNLKDNGGI